MKAIAMKTARFLMHMTLVAAFTLPAGAQEGGWIQTVPGKSWFVLLRLYRPLESFFDKTWRPSEIEEGKHIFSERKI